MIRARRGHVAAGGFTRGPHVPRISCDTLIELPFLDLLICFFLIIALLPGAKRENRTLSKNPYQVLVCAVLMSKSPGSDACPS